MPSEVGGKQAPGSVESARETQRDVQRERKKAVCQTLKSHSVQCKQFEACKLRYLASTQTQACR